VSNNRETLKSALWVVQGHWKWHFESVGSGYGFLFAFQSNYGSILYHFPDKARYRENPIYTSL